jgi:hypothetical protein
VGRTGRPLGITRIYELLDEGQGSRVDRLAEGAAGADDSPPESVVRPSQRPEGSFRERSMRSATAVGTSGRARKR